MAHVNKVMRSLNADDASRCVDVFARPDGTFGFEEYRRDVEDISGWFPVGHYGERRFVSEATAHAAAVAVVPWLREAPKEPDLAMR